MSFGKQGIFLIGKLVHYKKIYVKTVKNTKRTYFNNLDSEKVTDNRKFWKTVIPIFSIKSSKSEKII